MSLLSPISEACYLPSAEAGCVALDLRAGNRQLRPKSSTGKICRPKLPTPQATTLGTQLTPLPQARLRHR